jgi:hypothetical protein
VWRSGADKAIDSTILGFKEIAHPETIVGYVNKDIALPNCYTLVVLAIELIQEKPTQMGVYYGRWYIKTYCSWRIWSVHHLGGQPDAME